jgi:hypothetical protein
MLHDTKVNVLTGVCYVDSYSSCKTVCVCVCVCVYV